MPLLSSADPAEGLPVSLKGGTIATPNAPAFTPGAAGAIDPAQAWAANRDALSDYIAAQRQKSRDMGLLDPATGMPTTKGIVSIAQQYAGALAAGTGSPGITAYHGSPHSFDAFSNAAIGTGEGRQVYGMGHYFADTEAVARQYRDVLAPKVVSYDGKPVIDSPDRGIESVVPQNMAREVVAESIRDGMSPAAAIAKQLEVWRDNPLTDDPQTLRVTAAVADHIAALDPAKFSQSQGHMYEVGVNAHPETFLDWDKPLGDQSQAVQSALLSHRDTYAMPVQTWVHWGQPPGKGATGQDVYRSLRGTDAEKSALLQSVGINGVRYLDGNSRSAGDGTRNTVVFDPSLITILRKYGVAGVTAGGAASLAGQEQQ